MSKQEEVSDSLGMHLRDTTTRELSPETHTDTHQLLSKKVTAGVCLHSLAVCLEWMLS